MQQDQHSELENRRPLKVRQSTLVHRIARWLAQKSITPNQISILSIFCAALAAICFLFVPEFNGLQQVILYLFAALFIQARLLCNLFDGLVAVEGQKSTASGELFNDIPDRVSDPLIIIAAGYSVICVGYADILGWCGALLAVFTAYIRTLAVSIHAPANFSGPMAKQHRMALLTLACVISAIEQYGFSHDYAMLLALIILNVGCVLTIWRRTQAAYRHLEK
ncbi:CDP-alcohol phosphatidyltransferase family protein [Acinetobacter qingfengensis]|uniref:CDP-diacylglycerol--glycerol-3-phosphate 3-phosphatidyltransferase n=1 Tax=Acinetobacter qingfengensis TaxID=1262585 RepID=A0A1E7RDV3_9GAMM|nr:CDP-alcohol phosphatidyltransferase family protein [Acinetobacter qingfengensis]KAA8733721.1 CDP-alcohol phosphatidyltransferase family protein [Acinetobacter qingfengensis]OEY97463.1 CDP-diacylglycerol--glycerol-3-phosphate 3-phosphatidyltransferase [Acinetobacter qingfengensis]